ncbi:hypothetical protein [Vagococcus acidifermentans]|nr:hypothetical protein [Vagococcus acidifermentans]
MNLYLWNETSQMIRQLPTLIELESKASTTIYEINYTPYADEDGLIKSHSRETKKAVYHLLANNFFDTNDNPKMYLNKQEFLSSRNGGNDKSKLTAVTKSMLEEQLLADDIDTMFMNDLLIFDVKQSTLKKVEKSAANLNFSINIRSLRERFQSEIKYYVGNFIFGLVFSLIFMSFGALIIYWITSSSLKIFQQEIKLLRVVGLSTKKIISNFRYVLATPIVFASCGFVIFAYLTGFGVLLADYLYLILINTSLVLFSNLITKKKIWRMLDA